MTTLELELALDRPVTDEALREFRTRLEGGMSPDGGFGGGLPWLHLFVGRDIIEAVKILLEFDPRFGPDSFGRWPTVVAAECEVSEEMCDLVVEAEADWLERDARGEIAAPPINKLEIINGIARSGSDFKEWLKDNFAEEQDAAIVNETTALLDSFSDREIGELRELLATALFRGEIKKQKFGVRDMLVMLRVIRRGLGLSPTE